MTRVVAKSEQTVIAALVEAGVKRSTAKGRVAAGAVTVNDEVVTHGGARVRPGDRVEIGKPRPTLGAGLAVLHEDERLLAVDKPSGLLSVPTGKEKSRTAERAIHDYLGARPWRVHRLDRETSGVLLYAKDKETALILEANWRDYEKRYLALVSPPPSPARGTVDVPLRENKTLKVFVDEKMRGKRDAITHYETLRVIGKRALVGVRLETGRKHQIRVHLAHIGSPVVGDKRYEGVAHGRLGLHAHRLRFFLERGAWIEVEAPPPKGFAP